MGRKDQRKTQTQMLSSVQTEQKRMRKRKFSLKFAIYSLIFFICSLIFFYFRVRFRSVWTGTYA